ncbi:AraC family transcriptional regulator [Paenibacillus sp. YAF4_2]
MNKQPLPGLHTAARLSYRLMDVEILRDDPQASRKERAFIETKLHLLLLSNAFDGRIIIDGRLHILKPGWIYVCAPGQLIEWTNHIGQPLELLLLHFQVIVQRDNRAEASTLGADPLFPFLGEALLQSPAAASLLFDMISLNSKQSTASAWLRCEAGLLELLSLALTYQERQTEIALETARLELEHHYTSEIAIESLARIAGLSRFHFMRLFKERFGKGVAEYRTEFRLREAKRLMSGENLTLAEIVERIGYKNESYFSSLFKKQTGFAPAVYQGNRQRKLAAYSWINLGQLLALQMIPIAAPMDHYWTDRYRNKYDFEVTTTLSHHYELEREEDAETWLRRYDRDVIIAQEKLAPILGRGHLLVLAVGRNQLSVWGQQADTVLYEDLGIAMPPSLRDIDWNKPIEPSELAGIHADRILVHIERGSAAEAHWHQLSRSEAWLKLPAVQAGHVHLVFGYGCFDAPWNEHAAEPISRFLNDLPELFGIKN